MALIIIPQALTLPKGIPDQAVVLEVVKQESFGADLEVSSHPVEPDTAAITRYGSLVDHAMEAPREERVEAVVSDDPNVLLVGELAQRLFVALGRASSDPFSKTVFDRILLLSQNAVVCDIQSVRIDILGNVTVLSEYRDRLITSAKAERTTRRGLDISLTFREVKFAYSSRGEAQKAKTEKAQRQQQKPKDAGKTTTSTETPPPSGPQKSWLTSVSGR